MESATPESFHREWFRRVWNELDANAIDQMLAPDVVAHGLAPSPLTGPDAFRAALKSFTDAFHDIHVDVKREVSEGHLHAAFCEVRMTSRKDGRIVEFHGCPLIRVENGRMVEAWNTWDFLTFAQAMGAAHPDSMGTALAPPPS